MAKIAFNDRAYESFQASVPANLIGKEGYLVELIPGTRTIQLYTATAGIQPIGTIFQHLEGDSGTICVRMIGKAASCRMVASGVIAAGKGVKPVNGGTVIQANSGDTIVGVLLTGSAANAAANGDIIEVADNIGVAF